MSEKMMRWVLFGSISAVLLGAATGYALPEFILSIDFLGSLFFNALKLIIVPLIVTSLVMGIVSLGSVRKVGRTMISTLTYFMGTTSVAVIIGLALVLIFRPGDGVSSAGAILPSVLSNLQTFEPGTFLTSLIPSSFPQAIISGNYLGIIVVSIIFSFVLIGLGAKSKQIVQLFETFNEIVFKLVNLLLVAAPVGIFVLLGSIVAQNRDSLGQLAAGISGFAAVLLAGFLIHGLIILPLIMKRFTGNSPLSAFTAMLPALATAAGTASSTAALGITTHCVIEKAKVDRRASSFVLPLGAVINLDATAMYAVVATVFVAQVFGISLSLGQLLLIAVTGIIGSIGLAGLPFGAILLSAILFGVADFPAYAYAGLGLVFAVDWLFDRLRAVLNIWGDAVGATVVAGTFEFKTVRASRNLRTDRRPSSRPVGPGSRRTERSPRKTTSRSPRPDRDSRSPRDRSEGRTERTDSGRRTGRTVPTRARATDREDSRIRKSRNIHKPAPTARREQEPGSPFTMSSPAEATFNRESPSAVDKPTQKRPQMPAPPDLPKFDRPPRPQRKPVTASTSGETVKEAPTNNRPSKDALERELSKVAAQLANLDRKKSSEASSGSITESSENSPKGQATIDFLATENGTVTPVTHDNLDEKESPSDLKVTPEPETPATEPKPPATEPKPSATEPKPSATEPKPSATEPKPSATEPKPSATEPKPSAREFGRSRPNRTSPPPSKESEEADDKQTEEPVLTDTTYKSENQSFGRAKKKRIR